MAFSCSNVGSFSWDTVCHNCSSVSPSHRLQFFKECLSKGLFHTIGCSPSGTDWSSMGPSWDSITARKPAAVWTPLDKPQFCQKPTPVWSLHELQLPAWHIQLLWRISAPAPLFLLHFSPHSPLTELLGRGFCPCLSVLSLMHRHWLGWCVSSVLQQFHWSQLELAVCNMGAVPGLFSQRQPLQSPCC